MLLLIVTGFTCLLGLYSLVKAARRAPELDVDEQYFINHNKIDKQ
jgi:hypothetical protein